MQGHKQFLDKVVLRFRLSERVPRHNLYRRLGELLDWDFLYAQTQALYSHTGQPSLDPVVFFKLVLVGRLENIVSDRRLVEHCALRLDILYFLGYEVDEDLPWHSTISRTRQLYPALVFEHLFDQVFAQCLTAGLVVGQTNASLDSLRPKQPAPVLRVVDDTQAPVPLPAAPATPRHELRRVATRQAKQQRAAGGLGAHHTKA
jgi:transposase